MAAPVSFSRGFGEHPPDFGQRTVRKKTRTSSISNWGCSKAAKWPPRGISVQCATLPPRLRSTHARGGTLISLGKSAKPIGAGLLVLWNGVIDFGRAGLREYS